MLSSLLRTPRSVRVSAKSGPLNLQRVKISQKLKRPLFGLFIAPFLFFCITRTSDYWLPEDFRKALNALEDDLEKTKRDLESRSKQQTFSKEWQKAHDKASHEEGKRDPSSVAEIGGEKSGPLFIALPIWTRLKQPPRYTPDSKEWEEFIKLQKDDKRIHALYTNIARAVSAKYRRTVALQPSQNLLHDLEYTGELRVGLDIRIPIHPPAVYEIPGWSFGPNGVGWAWKTLPESYGSRLHRSFHPIIFAKCFWVGMEVFWRTSYDNAKAYFNGNSGSHRTFSSIMAEVRRGDPLSSVRKRASSPISIADPKVNEQDKATKEDATSPSAASSVLPLNKATVMQTHRNVVGAVTSEGAVKKAVIAFQSTFMRTQVEAWREMPRGACRIEGLIDFIGHRGVIRCRVVTIYMPAEDKFLGEPTIESTTLFPYAPELYQPRVKRERKRLLIQDPNAAQTKGAKPKTAVAQQEQALSTPDQDVENLKQEDQESKASKNLERGNGPAEKEPDTDENAGQSKLAHDGSGQGKEAPAENKDQEKNGS